MILYFNSLISNFIEPGILRPRLASRRISYLISPRRTLFVSAGDSFLVMLAGISPTRVDPKGFVRKAARFSSKEFGTHHAAIPDSFL